MTKKHVLIFSIAYFPLVGGAEVALREVLTRLKNEYNFTIITAKLNTKAPAKEVQNGIRIRRIGIGIPSIDKLLFPILAPIHAALIKHDGVFALLESYAALAANVYSWFSHKPTIINLQSGDDERWMKQKMGRWYFLYEWVYNNKHEYVVLSKYLADRAKQHGVWNTRITIIPNGADTQAFHPAKKNLRVRKELCIPKHHKVIITTGRLTHKNATDDLLRALPLIRKKQPDTTLIVCGVGEQERQLHALTNDLGITDHVRFVGLLPHDKLARLVAQADVFIRPSLSEGFGNSFVEALACGVPIIGTPVGGIPDFLTHDKTGLLCEVRNPQSIARAALRILESPELASRLASDGRALVLSKYTWDVIAEQYADYFRKVYSYERLFFFGRQVYP